jgi:hypothetical protein
MLLTTLRSIFETTPEDSRVIPEIFYAFYEMKDATVTQDVLKILSDCVESNKCDQNTWVYGFFYLKIMRQTRARDFAFQCFDNSGLPLQIRCLAADALRFIAEKNDVPALKARFELTPQDVYCGDFFRKYHSEAAVHLFQKDPLRALLLRAIGNQKNLDDYDWIWFVGDNKTEDPTTRKVAEIYVRSLDEQRKK